MRQSNYPLEERPGSAECSRVRTLDTAAQRDTSRWIQRPGLCQRSELSNRRSIWSPAPAFLRRENRALELTFLLDWPLPVQDSEVSIELIVQDRETILSTKHDEDANPFASKLA